MRTKKLVSRARSSRHFLLVRVGGHFVIRVSELTHCLRGISVCSFLSLQSAWVIIKDCKITQAADKIIRYQSSLSIVAEASRPHGLHSESWFQANRDQTKRDSFEQMQQPCGLLNVLLGSSFQRVPGLISSWSQLIFSFK